MIMRKNKKLLKNFIILSALIYSQQIISSDLSREPQIIQPGAPGKPSKVLDAKEATNIANTTDSTPTIVISADAGSTVTLYSNGTVLGTGVANSLVTITTPQLDDGDYDITATATDRATESPKHNENTRTKEIRTRKQKKKILKSHTPCTLQAGWADFDCAPRTGP